MSKNKIITHPGHAHFDEFLALSLIIAHFEKTSFEIERRDPSEEELNNPDIWVVDIGQRYEPDIKNFDHHQDLKLGASFVLIAKYLKLDDALKNAPWWNFKDLIDRRGDYKIAAEMGIDSLVPLKSPLEDYIIKLFKEDPNALKDLMKEFGKMLIKNALYLKEQIAFWGTCIQKKIKGKVVIIGETDDPRGSIQFSEQQKNPPAIRVCYDSRGNGWSMSTIKDAPGIDFFVLEGNDKIKFAHKNGFIAKTKERIPLKELLELMKTAIL